MEYIKLHHYRYRSIALPCAFNDSWTCYMNVHERLYLRVFVNNATLINNKRPPLLSSLRFRYWYCQATAFRLSVSSSIHFGACREGYYRVLIPFPNCSLAVCPCTYIFRRTSAIQYPRPSMWMTATGQSEKNIS